MLRIENLHASVETPTGSREILKGLTLAVGAGEVHAIMGPNGAGKSTLSYVLAGRAGYTVTSGSVTFQGQDLLALEPHARAAAGVFLGLHCSRLLWRERGTSGSLESMRQSAPTMVAASPFTSGWGLCRIRSHRRSRCRTGHTFPV